MKIELRTTPGTRAVDVSLIRAGEVFRGTIDNKEVFVMGTNSLLAVSLETGELIGPHTCIASGMHLEGATMLPYGRDLM